MLARMLATTVMPVAGILSSTVVVAGGVLTISGLLMLVWRVGRPLAKGITTIDEKVVPNVKYMPHLAKLDPMLEILEEVVAQVRTDSGSSLLDIVERLEGYARENREAAAEAKQASVQAERAAAAVSAALDEFASATAVALTGIEVLMGTAKEHSQDDRALARNDRDLARDALRSMRKLLESAERMELSGARTEASGARIEADQAVVAEDLAATQRRADEVAEHEPPGTAADAASQSPEDADGER